VAPKNKENAVADNHLELSRMEVEVFGPTFGTKVDVRVQRWFKNGDPIDRNTVFVSEDGSWKHHLTEQERKHVFGLEE
jgi:hypothetical protein